MEFAERMPGQNHQPKPQTLAPSLAPLLCTMRACGFDSR
jgi:hypothetical protein